MKNPNLAAIYDDRSFAGHPGGDWGFWQQGTFSIRLHGAVFTLFSSIICIRRIRGAWDLHRDRPPV